MVLTFGCDLCCDFWLCDCGLGLGWGLWIRIEDWELRLVIEIGYWNWGFRLGIRIEDWDWRLLLGLRIGIKIWIGDLDWD